MINNKSMATAGGVRSAVMGGLKVVVAGGGGTHPADAWSLSIKGTTILMLVSTVTLPMKAMDATLR